MTTIQVQSIRKIGKDEVFDIEVEDVKSYLLENNAVVSTTGGTYASDNIFILGRQQEKDGSDIVGFNIMLNVEKSRYCREKSVFPIELRYDGGMNKWSGLLDIALDIGFVNKPSNGWFCRVIDGVQEEQKWRRKDTNSADFWNVLLDSDEFNAAIEKRYRVAVGKMYQDEASLEPEDESELVE